MKSATCEIAETKQVERGTNDTCFYDCVSFKVLHFTIYVSDETLGTALHRLSEKQRSAILLRYFQGMNDREISELYRVSRSATTIYLWLIPLTASKELPILLLKLLE